jgi:pullulanase/glycogen debranching enzyme
VRAFWKGDEAVLPELAARLLGSSDLFEQPAGGKPWASVNFITAHDGFTLMDSSPTTTSTTRPTSRTMPTATATI